MLYDFRIAPSPAKSMAGSRLTWLGFDIFLTQGSVSYRAKLERALSTLDAAIAGDTAYLRRLALFHRLAEHLPDDGDVDRSNFMPFEPTLARHAGGSSTPMVFQGQLGSVQAMAHGPDPQGWRVLHRPAHRRGGSTKLTPSRPTT